MEADTRRVEAFPRARWHPRHPAPDPEITDPVAPKSNMHTRPSKAHVTYMLSLTAYRKGVPMIMPMGGVTISTLNM